MIETALPTYRCGVVPPDQLADHLRVKPSWTGKDVTHLLPVSGPQALKPSDFHRFVDTGFPYFHQPSFFAAAYSSNHLYISFHCLDEDIWGTYERRDDPLYEEEVVEAFLCPTGDLRHYYEFEVSPRNVVFDAKVYSPDLHRRSMEVDTSWDCPGLQTAVHTKGVVHESPPGSEKRKRGGATRQPSAVDFWWSVEMAIPFAAFPEVNPPKPGDVWRANFYRIDRADPPEFTAWSPTLESPPNFHVPERFGFLVFA